MSLNTCEVFRAKLSTGVGICLIPLLWTASDVWMMGITTVRATVLRFVLALSPVMAREQATVTKLMVE